VKAEVTQIIITDLENGLTSSSEALAHLREVKSLLSENEYNDLLNIIQMHKEDEDCDQEPEVVELIRSSLPERSFKWEEERDIFEEDWDYARRV
tara:strand:- start:321 stop:602 length:282 start_codon:yes stop_codon:yes gene_type:complete